MKSKWILYFGILLLLSGLFFKTFSSIPLIPFLLILSGISFKLIYMFIKIFSGEYKPGFELIFLAIGLLLFIGSYQLQNYNYLIKPVFLKSLGICFKIVFIIVFIIKVRKSGVKQISITKNDELTKLDN